MIKRKPQDDLKALGDNDGAQKTQENAYQGLRNMAFTATAEQLGLALQPDQASVFGVVMDWEMDGVIVTTVAFKTGDASLYLSTGGGVIGGGQHENVTIAAGRFIDTAQKYLEKTALAETQALPTKNQVKFYLLTNQGIFVGQEELENFENNATDWFELFEDGNKVLTELRKTSEGQ